MSHAVYVRNSEDGREPKPNEGVSVSFFRRRVRNDKGEIKDVEVARFRIAGDAKSQPEMRVTPDIISRFPKQYEAFKEGRVFKGDGIPLDEWPDIDVDRIQQCNLAGIYTVDQLANLSDAGTAGLGMGGRQLRDSAQVFMRTSAAGRAAAEVLKRDQELSDLKAQVAALTDAAQIAKSARTLKPRKLDDEGAAVA